MDGEEMEVDSDLGGDSDTPFAVAASTRQLDEDHLGYNPQINYGYDAQLRDDRRENKKKLKRRYENIFAKYERDFEGIGDEIDFETGEIVVNNGHIQNMRDENDVGDGHSVDDRQVSGDGDVASNDPVLIGNDHFEDESGEDGDGESDDDESTIEDLRDGEFSAQEAGDESATSTFEIDDSALSGTDNFAKATNRVVPHVPPRSERPFTLEGDESSADSTISEDVPGKQTPPDHLINGLKESVRTLQSKYKRGQNMDPDAIQALGMSIANQLANFMSQPGKGKSKRKSKDSLWACPALPGDQDRKRLRTPSPQPDLLGPQMSEKKSIWAPMGHPRQQKRRRMKEREPIQAPTPAANILDTTSEADHSTVSPSAVTPEVELRTCANCGSSDSEVWRKGPDGSLCNTCGMYFYRYGLLRPTAPLDPPEAPEQSEGDVDPLQRDWWLAGAVIDPKDGEEDIRPIKGRHAHFVMEEDALIIQLKEIDLLTWEKMSTYFPGRSAYALQCRYSKKLHGKALDARNILLEQGYRATPDANGIPIFAYTRKPFEDAEDDLLLKLRDEDGLSWEEVAASLPGRSPEVVETRYRELAEQVLGGSTATPERRRRSSSVSSTSSTNSLRYSDQEDALIIKLREVDKLNWSKVAENMEGRNSFSLQKRYIRNLCGKHPSSVLPPRKAYERLTPILGAARRDGEISDLESDLDASGTEAGSTSNAVYSAEEDAIILDLRNRQQLTWEQIDPRIQNRSRTSLIKRYNQLQAQGLASDKPRGREKRSAGTTLDDPAGEGSSRLEGSAAPPQSSVGTSRAEKSFTEAEDKLIVKLREAEHLPWPDIAAQLSEKTVSSISQRYYHYLLPRKLRAVTSQATQLRMMPPSPSSSVDLDANDWRPMLQKRWTTEEDDLLVKLRGEGKQWVEIASALPGRTAKAAKAHHASMFDDTKKAYRLRQSLPSVLASKAPKPLLRQAVKNSRRHSESGVFADVLAEECAGPVRPRLRPLLPKLAPKPSHTESNIIHEAQPSQANNDPKPTSIVHKEAPPPVQDDPRGETSRYSPKLAEPIVSDDAIQPLMSPISPTQTVRHSSEPTPLPVAIYATPARYNAQAHPYFVTLPAPYPISHSKQEPVPVLVRSEEAAAKKFKSGAIGSRLKDPDKAKGRSKATKAPMPKPQKPQKPRYSRRVRRESIADTTEDETGSDVIMDEDSLEEDTSDNASSVSDSAEVLAQEPPYDLEPTINDSEAAETSTDELQMSLPRKRRKVHAESAEAIAIACLGSHHAQAEADGEHVEPTGDGNLPNEDLIESDTPTGPNRLAMINPTPPQRPDQRVNMLVEDVQNGKPADGPQDPGSDIVNSSTEHLTNQSHLVGGRQLRNRSRLSTNSDPKPRQEPYGRSRTIAKNSLEIPESSDAEEFAGIETVTEGVESQFDVSMRGKEQRLELYDTEHVDAHSNETFYHRGAGRWAKGLPPVGELKIKPAIRYAGRHGESPRDPTDLSLPNPAKTSSPETTEAGFAYDDDDADKQKVFPNHRTSRSTRASRGKSVQASIPDVDISDNANSESLSHSKPGLVAMALEQHAPRPMLVIEIYDYLEENFNHLKQHKGWRDAIRAELSRNRRFKIASKEGKTGWVLADVGASVDEVPSTGYSNESSVTMTDASKAPPSQAIRPRIEEVIRTDNEGPFLDSPRKLRLTPSRKAHNESKKSDPAEQAGDSSMLQDSSELSIVTSTGAFYSAPPVSKTKTPMTTSDEKSTPATSDSTLFSRIRKLRGANRSTPARATPPAMDRLRKVATLENGRRVVETPMRDLDGSEDELA